MIGIMIRVLLVGSVYGFSKTTINVYNSTSVSGACKEAIKGVVVSCILSKVKHTILCSSLVATGVICVATGFNPLAVSIFVNNARLILDK